MINEKGTRSGKGRSRPFLRTQRLRLDPLAETHIEQLHAMWKEPLVRKYLWDDRQLTREEVREVYEQSRAQFQGERSGLWVTSLQNSDELNGFCGFWYFDSPPHLEMLYGVSTASWKQGFATEMGMAMLSYGFHDLQFDAVIASTDAANLASESVMQKCGMRFWRRTTVAGLDRVFYKLVREDFRGDWGWRPIDGESRGRGSLGSSE